MTTDRDDTFDRDDHDDRDAATDADLVRFMDGELAGADDAAVRARVADSPDVARRLDTLRRRSAGLSTLLADVDPDDDQVRERAALMRRRLDALAGAAGGFGSTRRAGPTRPTGRAAPRFATWRKVSPGLRAAAVIVLLLTAAFAVPPARAWVVDRVRDVVQALGLAGPPAAHPGDPAGPAGAGGPAGADMAVTFAVAGGSFEIHLTDPAAAIVVVRGTGATGSAEAEIAPDGARADPPGGSPAAAPGFVVLPGGLRIDGTGSGTTIRITLPPTVATIRVRVGDAPATVHALPAEGESLRIEPQPG